MKIQRELIDAEADKVVRRLSRHGYKAYLVGGCVRDLLLGREPKDFDVSTSATPKEIRALFRNCRIIGRRFTLAHIFFGQKIIETATFRANPRQDDERGELLIRRDNVFGNETEDAMRRDFTMNGLFYDVEDERVIDHVDGLIDIESRVVRTIGDPNIRFREDPVRMLRAVKFAARLSFEIGPKTYDALTKHRAEITKCAAPRLLEEIYRLLRGGAAVRSMELMVETGLGAMLSTRLTALLGGNIAMAPLLTADGTVDDDEAVWAATWAEDFADTVRSEPTLATELSPATLELSHLRDPEDLAKARETLWALLAGLDEAVARGDAPSNSLCLATLAMPFVAGLLLDPDSRPTAATAATIEVLGPLSEQLHAARRDVERARQILQTVRRLLPQKRRRGKPVTLLRRDYFRDTLRLYQMYADATGGDADDVVEHWRQLSEEQPALADDDETDSDRPRRRRRRRRGGRRRANRDSSDIDPGDIAPIS